MPGDGSLRLFEQEPTRSNAKSAFEVLRRSTPILSPSMECIPSQNYPLVLTNVDTHRLPQPEHSSKVHEFPATSCAFTPVNYSWYFPYDTSRRYCSHTPAHDYAMVDKRTAPPAITYQGTSLNLPVQVYLGADMALQLESGVISSGVDLYKRTGGFFTFQLSLGS